MRQSKFQPFPPFVAGRFQGPGRYPSCAFMRVCVFVKLERYFNLSHLRLLSLSSPMSPHVQKVFHVYGYPVTIICFFLKRAFSELIKLQASQSLGKLHLCL